MFFFHLRCRPLLVIRHGEASKLRDQRTSSLCISRACECWNRHSTASRLRTWNSKLITVRLYEKQLHPRVRAFRGQEAGTRVWPEPDPYETEKLEFDVKQQTLLLLACLTGLITGGGILVFSKLIHEIQDVIWQGQLHNGCTVWLRHTPIDQTWPQLVLGPAAGGAVVSLLRTAFGGFEQQPMPAWRWRPRSLLPAVPLQQIWGQARNALRSPAKTVAAAVTLGSGASLGPEGPSVEIGTSVARTLSYLFVRQKRYRQTLLAAGSAAGISAGFGAPISGVFFAVEAILSRESGSMKGKESGVAVASLLLASVCAQTLSKTSLGAAPLFTVPQYSIQATELPLYWALGALCGLLCTAFAYCSEASSATFRSIQDDGVPAWLLPVAGGLLCGLVSLAYPEIRYQAFDNVDAVLQSGIRGAQVYGPALILQILIAKVLLTSICRSSGLVGGLYAPSIFLGAALGMAYGDVLEALLPGLLMSPQQSFGLVGVAAVIAGNCRVPLTAILLLFELTHDYSTVLPTLGAVGLSYWVSLALDPSKAPPAKEQPVEDEASAFDKASRVVSMLGAAESSGLAVADAMIAVETVSQSDPLVKAVALLEDPTPACIIVVDDDNKYQGILTVEDIEAVVCSPIEDPLQTSGSKESSVAPSAQGISCAIPTRETSIGQVLDSLNRSARTYEKLCFETDMLGDALRKMDSKDSRYLPVVTSVGLQPVGVLDREQIWTQLRVDVIKEQLQGELVATVGPNRNA